MSKKEQILSLFLSGIQHIEDLAMLTMFNRARWTGKQEEAEPYRQWLAQKLDA